MLNGKPILLIIGLLIQCQRSEIMPKEIIGNFGEPISVFVGQKVIYIDKSQQEQEQKSDSLIIELLHIEDTTCPKGFTCISGGIATISFKMLYSTFEINSISCKLCTIDSYDTSDFQPLDTLKFLIASNNYILLFKDVIPEREYIHKKKKPDLQVVIEVQKLD